MTATNASDSATKGIFEEKIAGVVKLQGAIQVTVSETNAFLVTARVEGAWQAVEALYEFYQARGRKGTGVDPTSRRKGETTKTE